LSLERVLKTIEAFGLSRIEAEVYVCLAKKGPKKGRELASALQVTKQQLYYSLKNLKKKGIVTSSPKRPMLFEAVAFKEVIDLLVKIKREQSAAILETKEELLASWKFIDWKDNT
jgi:sugar-specific transcriptional regulator TrmB